MSVVAITAVAVVAQVWWSARHSSYDFPAFYRAAGLVAHGRSPYLPSHAVDRDFLNGPLIGLMYAPLSLMSYDVARLVALVVAMIVIVTSAALLSVTRPGQRLAVAAAFVVLVVATVPGRAALGLGQVTWLALLAFAVWYAAYRTLGARQDVVAGLAGCLLFQVKPYLAAPFLLVALVQARWRVLATTSVSTAATFAAASLLAGRNLLVDWVDVVADRQGEALQGNDQVSLLAGIHHVTGSSGVAVAVALLIAGLATMWLIRSAWSGREVDALLGAAACWPLVATTFLHPQDLIVACWPLLLVLFDDRHGVRRKLLGVLATIAFLDVWAIMGQPHSDAYVLLRQFIYAAPLWVALGLAGVRPKLVFAGVAATLLVTGLPVLARHWYAFPPWTGSVVLACGGLALSGAWLGAIRSGGLDLEAVSTPVDTTSTSRSASAVAP